MAVRLRYPESFWARKQRKTNVIQLTYRIRCSLNNRQDMLILAELGQVSL